MKEWSNKPSASLTTSSSPVRTVSSSPVVTASAPKTSLTGGAATLTGSSSTVTTSNGSLLAHAKVTATAGLATPVVAGTVVGGVAAVCYGVSNVLKYAKNEKSGKQAVTDTVKGSAGLGVATGLGIAAAGAVAGTSLALGTTLVVPIAAGAAAAYATARIWHRLFFREKIASTAKAGRT